MLSCCCQNSALQLHRCGCWTRAGATGCCSFTASYWYCRCACCCSSHLARCHKCWLRSLQPMQEGGTRSAQYEVANLQLLRHMVSSWMKQAARLTPPTKPKLLQRRAVPAGRIRPHLELGTGMGSELVLYSCCCCCAAALPSPSALSSNDDEYGSSSSR